MKITLWFSIALILVVSITYFVILSVSNQILQKSIQDNLVSTVANNVDEIEYYSALISEQINDYSDYYIQYVDGYLQIDDDFLQEVNGIATSLYQADDNTLIYGNNPIARATSEIEFIDGEIQEITVNGTLYYVFDRKLTLTGLEGLWLRGIVSEAEGYMQLTSISRISLIIMPCFLILAIIGGYLIARRAMRPVKQMSDMVTQIRESNDLTLRIQLNEGKDELHQLADRFNEMFDHLESSFNAQQQFVSDASHELRTPVSVITAQCELTLEGEQDISEYREALETISRQSSKMNRMISDMLDFVRLELHPEKYPKSEFNLTELVESLCHDMALIGENDITLSCDAEQSIYCYGNDQLITRLLSNLISNAYRYGRRKGHTSVWLRADGSDILLSVKDNGIGIAPEDHQKIFDQFYQKDPSRSSGGTGLGLAMVREIAHFHGGEISLESSLGHGSLFTLKMPNGKEAV